MLLSLRFVSILQVLLQIAIILTGNYNFFNLLTIVLCTSLLDDEFFYRRRLQKGKCVFEFLVQLIHIR